MTSRRTSRTLALVAAGASLLAFASPATAKGGGGGGGGSTPKPGAVQRTSAVASCTGGTSISVTVQKGNRSVVEQVLAITGPTAGWWNYALRDAATGQGLVVFGGTQSDLTGATAVITTSTGSTLAPGTYDLSFTGEHLTGQGGALVETCTANLTVQVV